MRIGAVEMPDSTWLQLTTWSVRHLFSVPSAHPVTSTTIMESAWAVMLKQQAWAMVRFPHREHVARQVRPAPDSPVAPHRRRSGDPYGRHPSQASHALSLWETVMSHRKLVVP